MWIFVWLKLVKIILDEYGWKKLVKVSLIFFCVNVTSRNIIALVRKMYVFITIALLWQIAVATVPLFTDY